MMSLPKLPVPRPRPFPPKPKPLPKRRIVTIAAGFLCDDGVLVCADSEVSMHTMKANDPKVDWVRLESVKVVMAGAGDAHLMNYVQQRCQQQISEGSSIETAEQTIREIIEAAHREHIYPVSSHPDQRPYIEMMFGLWAPERRCRLLESRGSAVVHQNVSLLGSGYEFGRSATDRLLPSKHHLKLKVAVFAAIRLLKEVKTYVQGCGGQNHILALADDGRIVPFFEDDYKGIHTKLDVLENEMRELFARIVGVSQADTPLKERLAAFVEFAELFENEAGAVLDRRFERGMNF